MLLMIAFVCFFLMFAAWLLVPNLDERAATSAAPESVPSGVSTLQTQV